MSIGICFNDGNEHIDDDDHVIGVCFDSDYNKALMESNYDTLVEKKSEYDTLRKVVREIYDAVKNKAEEYHRQSEREYLPVASMLLDRRAVGLLEASETIESILKQHTFDDIIATKGSIL